MRHKLTYFSDTQSHSIYLYSTLLYLSVSPPLSLHICICVSLSHTEADIHYLTLSLFVFLSLCLSLSVYLSLYLSISLFSTLTFHLYFCDVTMLYLLVPLFLISLFILFESLILSTLVSSDKSLYLRVQFSSEGSYDVIYGDNKDERETEVGVLKASLASPLPRAVGWETNERYVRTNINVTIICRLISLD